VRPHQSSCLNTNNRIGCQRNNSRTFTKQTEILVVKQQLKGFISFFSSSVLLNLPSLFAYCYSYPLRFPSFACFTIHGSPSQLLFLPLFIYFLPRLYFPLLSFPNLSPHYPSILLTHHPLTRLLYQLYTPHTLAIHNTSTFHYNNRNTPKYT
jgi:hypothetical protein